MISQLLRLHSLDFQRTFRICWCSFFYRYLFKREIDQALRKQLGREISKYWEVMGNCKIYKNRENAFHKKVVWQRKIWWMDSYNKKGLAASDTDIGMWKINHLRDHEHWNLTSLYIKTNAFSLNIFYLIMVCLINCVLAAYHDIIIFKTVAVHCTKNLHWDPMSVDLYIRQWVLSLLIMARGHNLCYLKATKILHGIVRAILQKWVFVLGWQFRSFCGWNGLKRVQIFKLFICSPPPV